MTKNKMVLTKSISSKVSRVEKRKLPEQVIQKGKKVKKAATKAEIIAQFEALQKEHEALSIEHNKSIETIEVLSQEHSKNIETIENLKEKIAKMEKDKDPILQDVSSEEIDPDEMKKCIECGYEAEDIYDFDAHLFSGDCQDKLIDCRHCDKYFQTKRDLMVHRKKKHSNKVKICQHFLSGSCDLSDDKSWYKHKQKDTGNDDLFRIQCSNCEQVFKYKFDLMHHIKSVQYQ